MPDLMFNTQQLTTSRTEVPAENQDPVISGDNVYVAYTLASANSPVILDISNDGGQTYRKVKVGGPGAYEPRVAAYNGRVYLTWEQHGVIYYSFSSNGGLRFSRPVALGPGINPQINASGGNIIIGAPTADQSGINIWVSHDSGEQWSAPIPMSTESGVNSEVVVATRADNDYVAWNDKLADGSVRAFEATSNNGGSTFAPTIDLNPTFDNTVEPIFAISANGQVNIVFRTNDAHHPTEGYLGFVKSTDRGASFSQPVILAKHIRGASIAADGTNLDVSFFQRGTTDWQVQFLHSADRGSTWDNPVDMADTGWSNNSAVGVDTYIPSEDAEGGFVNLSWVTADGVYAAISNDYGVAGSFSSSAYLGQGGDVLPAGPLTLWLDSNNHAELTTFQTSFWSSGSSASAAVAKPTASAQQNLVHAMASFGAAPVGLLAPLAAVGSETHALVGPSRPLHPSLLGAGGQAADRA